MFSGRVRTVALAILLASCSIAHSRAVEKVDINHASLAELEQLPGVTKTWAQRIVRFRPYKTKLDLVRGGIIPTELYAKIRDGIIAHRDAH